MENQLKEVSQASAEVGQQFGQLSSSVTGQGEAIKSTITDFQAQLAALRSESEKELDQAISANAQRIEDAIQQLNQQHKTLTEEHQRNANEVLSVLESRKQEASDLVQIIGNIGITGNYQNIANQEKSAADKWRTIALTFMITMVLAITLTIFLSVRKGFDWELVIFRLTAALVLIIPAAYAARESSKHRALETHNRRAELELASLDPYLEKLPEEKRNEIKENLTQKFFGLNGEINHEDEPVTYNALLGLIKLALKGK